jgi:hypothetical protein
MTKSEWIDICFSYVRNLSPETSEPLAMEFATNAAAEQETRTKSADAAMWQSPGAAAQQAMNSNNAAIDAQERRRRRVERPDPGYSEEGRYAGASVAQRETTPPETDPAQQPLPVNTPENPPDGKPQNNEPARNAHGQFTAQGTPHDAGQR